MSDTQRPRCSKSVAIPLVVLAASSWLTAGCGGQDDEQVYCTDRNGQVVDTRNCDDGNGHGGIYIFRAGTGSSWNGLRPGQTVPKGGSTFSVGDSAARSSHGLSGTGKVSGVHGEGGGFGVPHAGGGGHAGGGHAGGGGHGAGS